MQTSPNNNDISSLPTLPGTVGLPLLGETLVFLKNPYKFLEGRRQRYGNAFKSHVFGGKIVFVAGIEGAEAFYNPENIIREKSHPFPFVAIFGGKNVAMYDGPKHFALKSMGLTAFDTTALTSYLPDMQLVIEKTLERLALLPDFSAVSEFRKLAIEAICCNIMGLFPSAETDAITRDYGIVLEGLLAMPVKLPGTTFSKALAARDRLLDRFRQLIAERRKLPAQDGLSRMLAAKAPDGSTYTDEEALYDLHHIVIAGFITYALMAEAVRQLAEQPALYKRCLEEIRQHAAEGPLTMSMLSKLRVSTNVILEAKRFVPIAPIIFGRALRDFDCCGFKVPKGRTVSLAIYLSNSDATIYTDPKRFDPDRFGPERNEHLKHPMAFIPQGTEPPTGHRCLGLDYSTVFSVAFLALLIRNYSWELPPQDLAYKWNSVPLVTRDGLRVKLKARSFDI